MSDEEHVCAACWWWERHSSEMVCSRVPRGKWQVRDGLDTCEDWHQAWPVAHPLKRILIAVEWHGAASEQAFGDVCAKEIEEGDVSRVCRVVFVEHMTNHGATRILSPEELKPYQRRTYEQERARLGREWRMCKADLWSLWKRWTS